MQKGVKEAFLKTSLHFICFLIGSSNSNPRKSSLGGQKGFGIIFFISN